MFYRQDKIDYIDRDNEEFIISFKSYDLIFKISGYKEGLNIIYDGEGVIYDKHAEGVYFNGKIGKFGKHEINGVIRSPLDFVKGNPLAFKELKSIVLGIDGLYVTIYGGSVKEFFDAEVKIIFKEK